MKANVFHGKDDIRVDEVPRPHAGPGDAGSNAWREFAPGSFIDPKGWRRIPKPPTLPQSAIAYFRTAAAATKPLSS